MKKFGGQSILGIALTAVGALAALGGTIIANMDNQEAAKDAAKEAAREALSNNSNNEE